MRLFLFCLSLLVFVAVLFVLDGAGVFIYFGYILPYATAVAVGATIPFILLPASYGRTRWFLGSAVIAALLASVWLCSVSTTSARKAFFLAVESLRQGQSIAHVRKMLGPYDHQPYEGGPSSLTFSFRSGPGTVDHAIVDFSEGRLVRVEFSAD